MSLAQGDFNRMLCLLTTDFEQAGVDKVPLSRCIFWVLLPFGERRLDAHLVGVICRLILCTSIVEISE